MVLMDMQKVTFEEEQPPASKLFKSLPHKAAFSPSWLPLIYMLVIPCMQPRKTNLKQNLMMIQMDNFLKFLKEESEHEYHFKFDNQLLRLLLYRCQKLGGNSQPRYSRS
jgi:hypothetical protein